MQRNCGCSCAFATATAATRTRLIACLASFALLPLLLSPTSFAPQPPLLLKGSVAISPWASVPRNSTSDSHDSSAAAARARNQLSHVGVRWPVDLPGISASSRGGGGLSAAAAALKRASDERLRLLFRPAMTDVERLALLGCLRLLAGAFSAAGVEFFMYGGTLLGSYRHHGLVPWDDDADVAASVSQSSAAARALASAPPGASECALYARDPVRWKYFATGAGSSPIEGREWRWPFVDVCFFGDNGTHVYDVDPVYRGAFIYRRDDVFPLALRPFDSLLLPAPRDPRAVLEATYDPLVCATGTWSHRREAPADELRAVRCSRLHGVYPFVFRREPAESEALKQKHGRSPPGVTGVTAVREELRLAGELVGEFLSFG